MCLEVNVRKTKEFYKKHQNNHKIVVWKVLMKNADHNNQIQTPCFKTSIELGQELKPYTIKYCSYPKQKFSSFDIVDSGVIHTYETRKKAREQAIFWKSLDGNIHFVVRCTADINDFVAYGRYNDAGFLKVQIGHNEKR